MRTRKGFTLVELLVVIAVIAILMSILIPSLQTARRKAAGVVCVTNQKTLLTACSMYADDNNDVLPMSCPGASPTPWRAQPTANDMESKLAAIRRGSLWNYVKNVKAYRCPADQRKYDGTKQAYVTYDMPAGVNAGYVYGGIVPIRKRGQLTFFSEKYFFVEGYDPRGGNLGSWALHEPWDLRKWDWEDGLALWHLHSTTIGFGDGHAEIHVWQDERTEDYFNWLVDTKPSGLSSRNTIYANQVDNPDLVFMKMGFPYDKKKTPRY